MTQEPVKQQCGSRSKAGFEVNPQNINREGAPPKTHWWTELYMKELELESRKMAGLKKKEVIVKTTVEKAEEGEQWAVKEVGDRVAGKSPQGIGSVGDEGNFTPQSLVVIYGKD